MAVACSRMKYLAIAASFRLGGTPSFHFGGTVAKSRTMGASTFLPCSSVFVTASPMLCMWSEDDDDKQMDDEQPSPTATNAAPRFFTAPLSATPTSPIAPGADAGLRLLAARPSATPLSPIVLGIATGQRLFAESPSATPSSPIAPDAASTSPNADSNICAAPPSATSALSPMVAAPSFAAPPSASFAD